MSGGGRSVVGGSENVEVRMNITVVGSGYVGLVTASCLASSGNHVMAADSDRHKIEALSRGKCTFFEPGLREMLVDGLDSGRLKFSTDIANAVSQAQVVFICVGTPSLEDGSADLSAVEDIACSIAQNMSDGLLVVIKSTVPVGAARRVSELIESRTAHPCTVVSNPEFLREGTALNDFLRPDRVVVGTNDPEAMQVMRELYAPFVRTNQNILFVSNEAAEMIKYASNAYLATRISFINEIADICARTGVDVGQVRAGLGADKRIGSGYLFPGAGYGGSCFPKDVQALIHVGQQAGADVGILRQVHLRNERQKRLLAEMVLERLGPDLTGRTIALWGLAFKPDTDDIRQAPAMEVIRRLRQAGATLRCYDPKACLNARYELGDVGDGVTFECDPYAVLDGADALVICTEWNEFRTPQFDVIRRKLKERIIFDGRNLYEPATLLRQRLEYHSIGRQPTAPVKSISSKPIRNAV